MTSIFIDTNIFIRILTHDNETLSIQAESIYKKIENGDLNGIVSILVINETLWVLENYYDLSRNLYVPAFTKLLAIPNIDILETKKDNLMKMLKYFASTNFDFTDIYLRSLAKSEEIASFDNDIQKISI